MGLVLARAHLLFVLLELRPALGGALGVAAKFLMPGFPAGDLLTAAAVGIVSGLAATGGYEAVRQLRRCEQKEDPQ